MPSSTDRSIGQRFVRCLAATVLLSVFFVILGRVADQTLNHLSRGLPVLFFLLAAIMIAYAAFATILYLASTSRRPAIIHGIAAGVTLIWLLFLLARSTLTESG